MTRPAKFLTVVAAAVVLGAGTATAAKLITGSDVKDGTLTGVDVRPASLGAGLLTEGARRELRGARGERGPSDAYGVRGKGRVRVRPGAVNALLSKRVAAGAYTIEAKAVLLNAKDGPSSPNCQLLVSTGGRFSALDQVNDIPLSAQGSPGDTAEVVVLGFTRLGGPGTLRLRCTPGPGERFSARDRVLIATRTGAIR